MADTRPGRMHRATWRRLAACLLAGLILQGCRSLPDPGADNLVAVCHEGGQTMYLAQVEARQHAGHGDYYGECL